MSIRVNGVAAVGLVVAGATAWGHPNYLAEWMNQYPSSTLPVRMQMLTGNDCNVCHQPPQTNRPGTCYRDTIAGFIAQGFSMKNAIREAGTVDSDGDGTINNDEINMPRLDQPGHVGYHPGLRDPIGRDPCATDPLAAVTNELETPPAPCPSDLDDGSGTGTPDGGTDINDLLYFLARYEAADLAADVDDGSGTGTPDGGVDINDLLFFLGHYESGC